MATTEGFTTDQFQGVREVLANSIESGADVGASVAVYSKGELVVDIWGGHLDETRSAPWVADTIVNVWSTTKTMTFLVALMLADRGELDFFAPVVKYWPEFGANGKASIEVRHLLSHSAGLSGWAAPMVPEDLADWERCTANLAAQAPWWEPGTASGYHALTQGYLIGEVVRRITGTSIGSVFASEVATPLGADFHIGLPASQEHRVSMVIPPSELNLDGVPVDSIAYRTLTSPAVDATMPQHRWWRAAEIPAANGHGNARSVATIQSIIANRGRFHDQEFFSPATSDLIFETQQNGIDLVLGTEFRFGMGYGLSTSVMPLGPRSCFWGGFGGSVIIMDQDLELTVAYMMNKMRVGLVGDTRGSDLAVAATMAALS